MRFRRSYLDSKKINLRANERKRKSTTSPVQANVERPSQEGNRPRHLESRRCTPGRSICHRASRPSREAACSDSTALSHGWPATSAGSSSYDSSPSCGCSHGDGSSTDDPPCQRGTDKCSPPARLRSSSHDGPPQGYRPTPATYSTSRNILFLPV